MFRRLENSYHFLSEFLFLLCLPRCIGLFFEVPLIAEWCRKINYNYKGALLTSQTETCLLSERYKHYSVHIRGHSRRAVYCLAVYYAHTSFCYYYFHWLFTSIPLIHISDPSSLRTSHSREFHENSTDNNKRKSIIWWHKMECRNQFQTYVTHRPIFEVTYLKFCITL
jgi:hypothetical protein